MSLFAKLGTIGFAGVSIGLPIPFVLRIGCGDPSTSKTWTRWVTEFPSLYCSGSKSNIYVSLAFKSEWSGIAQNDLYLKGQGYDSIGKPVNFDEKVTGTGSSIRVNASRWKLNVFGSGAARIYDLEGKIDDSEDDVECDGKPFVVTRPTYRESDRNWANDASKIKFELINCSKKSKGRQICDIEIADSVGLKWGTKVKPKAIFCASH